MTIPSSKNTELGLDKDGYWTNRHQRSIVRDWWGTSDFVYAGPLPAEEAGELAQFWERLDMLGRRNE